MTAPTFQIICGNCKETYTMSFDNKKADWREYSIGADAYLSKTACEVCGEKKLTTQSN